MSIDLLVQKTGKERKIVQMDYLSAYRTYTRVKGLKPRVAYFAAYAHLSNSYHKQQLQRGLD